MTAITLKKLHVELHGGSQNFKLSNIDLSIKSGELVVIAGPSGVGKSTLLKVIAGLVPIQSGEVCFDEQRVDTLKAADRNVGMVFQNFSLYPHYSVARNLGLGLTIKGENKTSINNQVAAIAKKLNIESLLDSLPRTLSGGQKQRVAIGRAMLSQPKVFLFDEPLSNLDVGLRITLRNEIRELHDGLNTASVFVTHDQSEAFSLADRILLMSNKGVEQFATPQEIYQSPKSLFAAKFFGIPQINCYQGRYLKGVVELDNGLKVNCSLAEKYVGEKVTIAVRPSKLFMLKHKGIQAHIVSIEHQPEVLWVTAKLIDSDESVVFETDTADLEENQIVRLGVKLEDMLFFDSKGLSINF